MFDKQDLRSLNSLLGPYRKISQVRFFVDLSVAALLAWGALYLLSVRELDVYSPFLLFVSYVGSCRGNAFIHEVVHFGRKVKGIGAVYNFLFGFPNRIPFYIHEPHKYHHLPNTFGTEQDPEYLFLKGKGGRYFFRPFFAAPLAPLLLLVRFGVLPLFFWALPASLQEEIYRKVSTLVVNPGYLRREMRSDELRRVRRQDLGCALFFVFFLMAGVLGQLPWAFFGWWYAIAVVATLVNMYRARVAHLYDNKLGALSPLEALRDSVTIEGGMASELWAPLGLKYHSLHHLAPNIPYHNLGKAHRFLVSQLEANHPYHATIQPSLWHGLKQYWRTLHG